MCFICLLRAFSHPTYIASVFICAVCVVDRCVTCVFICAVCVVHRCVTCVVDG